MPPATPASTAATGSISLDKASGGERCSKTDPRTAPPLRKRSLRFGPNCCKKNVEQGTIGNRSDGESWAHLTRSNHGGVTSGSAAHDVVGCS